jgi:ATP-dependent Clp protease protease subunit
MAKKSGKDDIDNFHIYNIHFATRTLYIGSIQADENGEAGIDNFTAAQVIKNLYILDNTKEADQPINIILNTPGGDFYHGIGIYDAIRQCKNEVNIVGYGYVMSMGSVIMQAADNRAISENACMMLHYGTNGFGGHSKDFESWANENSRINVDMESIYLERIKQKHPSFTRKKLQKLITFDRFLTAKAALELGLVDKIITSKEDMWK